MGGVLSLRMIQSEPGVGMVFKCEDSLSFTVLIHTELPMALLWILWL
jgi:hypothetical protein